MYLHISYLWSNAVLEFNKSLKTRKHFWKISACPKCYTIRGGHVRYKGYVLFIFLEELLYSWRFSRSRFCARENTKFRFSYSGYITHKSQRIQHTCIIVVYYLHTESVNISEILEQFMFTRNFVLLSKLSYTTLHIHARTIYSVHEISYLLHYTYFMYIFKQLICTVSDVQYSFVFFVL